MTLTARASLGAVAAAVGDALRRGGVKAVLTGGACAALHTRGAHHSVDMDFIIVGDTTQERVDAAMASVGFTRRADRYVHPRLRFYVEFPRAPLGIGADYRIAPEERRAHGRRLLVLSATDSCRDRLAAYYHWNDRQSLDVAVAIARRNRVDVEVIRRWSADEGFPDRFDEFMRHAGVRRAGRRRRPPGSS